MIFRIATISDIPSIQLIRHSVKENVLSDASLVTDQNCADYLMKRGRGWVCEIKNTQVGFCIADLVDNNIWALFVHPKHERQGIGRSLHGMMLDWYFSETKISLWLSTAPGTRAEAFYKKAGWMHAGLHGREVKFEMSYDDWMIKRNS
jgi:GNAT superfamily N-acetyltransferase